MQRRTLAAATAALTVTLSLPVLAGKEGEDYVILQSPLPHCEGTLVKVFSYDCPYCFKFDLGVDPRVLPRIETEAGLKFKPMHLETKGKFGRCASVFLAMCMIRDEKAGVSIESDASLFRKAKDAVYHAYHKMNERWDAGEAAFLKTMTDATGLSAKDYEKARKDAAVSALADSWKAAYAVAKVQGIPAYVVNGKYLLQTRAIRNFNGMVELVKELATKK